MTSTDEIEPRHDNTIVSFLGESTTRKLRSRSNGRRPGLATETVIDALEDDGDYRAFELSVTSGFDAQDAVARELVLRLANLLWRLRRAAAIETGLLQISGEVTDNRGRGQLNVLEPYCGIAAKPRRAQSRRIASKEGKTMPAAARDKAASRANEQQSLNTELAERYLRLDFFDCGAFERLSRYETGLWKQVGQLLVTLNSLHR